MLYGPAQEDSSQPLIVRRAHYNKVASLALNDVEDGVRGVAFRHDDAQVGDRLAYVAANLPLDGHDGIRRAAPGREILVSW
jgi:hypothetical protein